MGGMSLAEVLSEIYGMFLAVGGGGEGGLPGPNEIQVVEVGH